MRHVLKSLSTVLSVGFLVAIVGVVFYWQDATDYYKFNSYQPTPTIASLADRSGMSDKGKFYFYATSPRLEVADQFNDECRRSEKGSPILGCYKAGFDTIHIFDITNPELDGIREVTAAHEMLHAVFARMTQQEIVDMTPRLEQAYSRLKTNKLEERMQYYEVTAPGTRVNELHSIIGTEFTDIGPELEDYYAKYFSSRQSVVSLHQNYSQKFDEIERQINELIASLNQQAEQVESLSLSYDQDMSVLNQQISQFNRRAESGGFSTQSEFQQVRSQLNQQIAQLNNRRFGIQQMIDNYNAETDRLNDLSRRLNELNQGIDSMREMEQGIETI